MNTYREQVYAGVLGKMIGVFFGRPVEGWPYPRIRDRFGLVDRYTADELGVPLHVADDDLAGTFTFINALEDLADRCRTEGRSPSETAQKLRGITAAEFGETWLDYVIENKTIFWWGGIGRSTEHTAYERLKQGIPAPLSGSAKMNGTAVAEQIGAQIFMDALALMCPNDPLLARHLVRQCASVSHDGLAVESACFLASLEAMAFSEKNLDILLENALALTESIRLREIVTDVADFTRNAMTEGTAYGRSEEETFRTVRDWLELHYGYRLYPGNCHVVPNLTLIIASLLLGGDSFARAMQFCVSGGWDTDCNGANLGVINGVRLGLSAIDEDYPFREAVADRFYITSADGGACVTDAVREMNRIVRLHNALYETDEPVDKARFSFSMPGSVQGFVRCPIRDPGVRMSLAESNRLSSPVFSNPSGEGLGVEIPPSGSCCISTLTMWTPNDRLPNYLLIGSPTLYEGQTVKFCFEAEQPGKGEFRVQPYVVYVDFDDYPACETGPEITSAESRFDVSWTIPVHKGYTIMRLGLKLSGPSGGRIFIKNISWNGAPEQFAVTGSLKNYKLDHPNMQMQAFVTSAAQFSFDSDYAFVVSHTGSSGIASIGTSEWDDYSITASVKPSLHSKMGIIGRNRGLRRHYALVLSGGDTAALICRCGAEEHTLSRIPFEYELNKEYRLTLSMKGSRITGTVGQCILEAEDRTFRSGGAGFLVEQGTFLADGIEIRRL